MRRRPPSEIVSTESSKPPSLRRLGSERRLPSKRRHQRPHSPLPSSFLVLERQHSLPLQQPLCRTSRHTHTTPMWPLPRQFRRNIQEDAAWRPGRAPRATCSSVPLCSLTRTHSALLVWSRPRSLLRSRRSHLNLRHNAIAHVFHETAQETALRPQRKKKPQRASHHRPADVWIHGKDMIPKPGNSLSLPVSAQQLGTHDDDLHPEPCRTRKSQTDVPRHSQLVPPKFSPLHPSGLRWTRRRLGRLGTQPVHLHLPSAQRTSSSRRRGSARAILRRVRLAASRDALVHFSPDDWWRG